ncbi:hypothetical protein NQ317_000717 [Molorchus minor]|uniref:Uncharacterized protein n=1 Tax=Molorchus minor TaxID=1323400 RepID=A0ABQ9JHN1_9CUCU|nr:hypothetical protein NQ317_000717 [Molorchus minor]
MSRAAISLTTQLPSSDRMGHYNYGIFLGNRRGVLTISEKATVSEEIQILKALLVSTSSTKDKSYRKDIFKRIFI